MSGPDLLLPEGSVLLHVGPPKTATTSVQSAFHHGREATRAQGVHYAGSGRQPMSAAIAVTRDRSVPGWSEDGQERWQSLVREVRRSDASRVVVSSEFFADGDDAAIARVVDGLGRDRVHVVLTLRSVARVLPSQWQQFTQVHLAQTYEGWLHGLFDHPLPDDPPIGFWRRHRHDVLARRWAAAVGAENVTVVVADEHDHDHVLHAFEDMTGLRRGTLVPSADDVNRSLTLDETALMREVNRQFAATDQLDEALYTRVFRYGLATHLKQRPTGGDEARVSTPRWAVERAQQVGRDAAAVLATSDVRVVGDLASLESPPRDVADEVQPTHVPVEVAARAAIGVALGAARQQERAARTRRRLARDSVARAPSRVLLDELRQRLVRRVARLVGRGRGVRPRP